jgi:hypothetical protein
MVACGLAMGVFVGLVVVRGTGEAEGSSAEQPVAAAETPVVNPPAQPPQPQTGDVLGDPPPPLEVEKPPDPEPAVEKAVLSFSVTPKSATVTVDGAKVAKGQTEIKLVEGKARVRVVVTASGYKGYEKSVLVTGDEKLDIELVKKPKKTGGGKGGGKPSGPGGLIDLR